MSGPIGRFVNFIANASTREADKTSDKPDDDSLEGLIGHALPSEPSKTSAADRKMTQTYDGPAPKEKALDKGKRLVSEGLKMGGNVAKGSFLFCLGKVVQASVALAGGVKGLASTKNFSKTELYKNAGDEDKKTKENLEAKLFADKKNIKLAKQGLIRDSEGLPQKPFIYEDEARATQKKLDEHDAEVAQKQGVGFRGGMAAMGESNAGIIGNDLVEMGLKCFKKIGGEKTAEALTYEQLPPETQAPRVSQQRTPPEAERPQQPPRVQSPLNQSGYVAMPPPPKEETAGKTEASPQEPPKIEKQKLQKALELYENVLKTNPGHELTEIKFTDTDNKEKKVYRSVLEGVVTSLKKQVENE